MQAGPKKEMTESYDSSFSVFLRLTLRTTFSHTDMLDAAYVDMLEIHKLVKQFPPELSTRLKLERLDALLQMYFETRHLGRE